MKRPSFQFYPQDWRSDPGLRACTREERSVWIDLLCIMHDSPRRGVLLLPSGEPMPIEEIARNIGETRTKTLHFLEKIAQRGVSSTEPETGALFSRRMVRDEYISQLRSSVGGLGGNPVLLTKSQANVQPKVNPFFFFFFQGRGIYIDHTHTFDNSPKKFVAVLSGFRNLLGGLPAEKRERRGVHFVAKKRASRS